MIQNQITGGYNVKATILEDSMMIIDKATVYVEINGIVGNSWVKVASVTDGEFNISTTSSTQKIKVEAFGYKDAILTAGQINSAGAVTMAEAVTISVPKKEDNTFIIVLLTALGLGGIYLATKKKSAKTVKL